ncbi:MAG TPA: response regulator transcription factor [Ilumatobacteraceae bacterium]|nr:response regulator transcription factor [Ilumatobacteraceae bacterium]
MTDDTTITTVRTPAEGNGPIRVFVVDDHPAFLRTVAVVIDATPGFTLAGTAESGVDAWDSLAARSDVDMVLLDVNLPDVSGIEIARRRAEAGAKGVVVLMSTADPADLPADAFDRGVAGFLPKERLTTQELRAIWDDANDVS